MFRQYVRSKSVKNRNLLDEFDQTMAESNNKYK